jgi:hypothetical protein
MPVCALIPWHRVFSFERAAWVVFCSDGTDRRLCWVRSALLGLRIVLEATYCLMLRVSSAVFVSAVVKRSGEAAYSLLTCPLPFIGLHFYGFFRRSAGRTCPLTGMTWMRIRTGIPNYSFD